MTGLTLSEISEKLGVPVNTLRQRMTRLGIKPITKEALYSESVLPILANIKMGRPKTKSNEPAVHEMVKSRLKKIEAETKTSKSAKKPAKPKK